MDHLTSEGGGGVIVKKIFCKHTCTKKNPYTRPLPKKKIPAIKTLPDGLTHATSEKTYHAHTCPRKTYCTWKGLKKICAYTKSPTPYRCNCPPNTLVKIRGGQNSTKPLLHLQFTMQASRKSPAIDNRQPGKCFKKLCIPGSLKLLHNFHNNSHTNLLTVFDLCLAWCQAIL